MTFDNSRFKTLCEIDTDKNYKDTPFKFFEKYENEVLHCLYSQKAVISSFYEVSGFETIQDISILKIVSDRVRVEFKNYKAILKVLSK